MNFKKNIISTLGLLLLLFASCDIIPENERILDMEKVDVKKNVLLLDFTDQFCVNCAEAAEIVDTLLEAYNPNLIAVSIHASPISLPLVTKEGKEYDTYFKINYTHPSAVVDGLGNYTAEQFRGAVLSRIKETTSVQVEIKASFEELSKIRIETNVSNPELIQGLTLQLWIVEDSIVDYQKMQDYTENNYIHRHVFRTSVNGTWGESIAIQEETQFTYLQELSDKWEKSQVHIVGFVRKSNNEVLDVKQTSIDY